MRFAAGLNGKQWSIVVQRGHIVSGLVPIYLSFLVVVAGVSVALQQVLNANLRMELGSPWWAGLISYLGGSLAMLMAVALSGEPWLSGAAIARSSWISWTSGLFGAIFIGIAILMVPRLGAATVLALIVLGQMLGALTFDHFGLLGIPQHPATPLRVAGAACLLIGVVLIRA
jgi:transporter family-2 protein